VNNPPAEAAARRELFYTLVHEVGHAFNLPHPTERAAEGAWRGPPWALLRPRRNALTFLNYPNLATPEFMGGANASWFYRRFSFCLERFELLFLRHAPGHDVVMGGAEWRTSASRRELRSVDKRLELTVRSRREVLVLGERVVLELKLANRSDRTLTVHEDLHPNEGLVRLVVVRPDGSRCVHLLSSSPVQRYRRPNWRPARPSTSASTSRWGWRALPSAGPVATWCRPRTGRPPGPW
jgi:hypothetical protein